MELTNWVETAYLLYVRRLLFHAAVDFRHDVREVEVDVRFGDAQVGPSDLAQYVVLEYPDPVVSGPAKLLAREMNKS